jgi:hypothetical protein
MSIKGISPEVQQFVNRATQHMADSEVQGAVAEEMHKAEGLLQERMNLAKKESENANRWTQA